MPRRTSRTNLSDRDLLAAARSGDRDAFGALWTRHAASIRKAVTFFTGFDPDDVTAETFARVMSSIERGHGPIDLFRPYAMVAARNIATEWARARPEVPLDAVGDIEDETLADFSSSHADDRSLAGRAFSSLPDRWQEVLWYTEVEQMKPAEIAPLLGISANSVAALAVRAREGLKQAFISAHVRSDNVPDEHKWVIERAGKYARNKLPTAQRRSVDEHLEDCPNCRLAFAEIDTASSRIALVLLPLVLGSAAPAYAAWAAQHAAPAGTTAASVAAVPRGFGAHRARYIAGATGVVAAIAVGAVIAHAITGADPQQLAAAPAAAAAPVAPAASSNPTPDDATPAQPGPRATRPDPAGTTVPPAPVLAVPNPTPGAPNVTSAVAPAVGAPVVPGASTTPTDSATPPSAPTAPTPPSSEPTPPTEPTTPPAPPADPDPTSPTAPDVSVDQPTADLLPILSGTATPSAVITVTATSTEQATATFQTATTESGAWSIVPELPAAGSWTLTATQTSTADGVTLTSPASNPVTVAVAADDLTIQPYEDGNGGWLYWITGTEGRDVLVRHPNGTEDTIQILSGDVVFITGPKSRTDPAAVLSIAYGGTGTHGITKDVSQYLTD